MKNPQRINLNTAEAKLIASSLHGIGQGLAEDIVQLRDQIANTQGQDIELEDLTQIPTNRIPLAAWKENFVRNYICFDDTMNPPSRKEVCEVFPTMFSAEELAAYEAAVLGNMGAIMSHVDQQIAKLQTEQSNMHAEQNKKIESVQVEVSKQVEDAKQALTTDINTVKTDLLAEIGKVNRSTSSLMDSIREMREEIARSSRSMQETVDSVLAKVAEHDKALQQKFSSPQTQMPNAPVPSTSMVLPVVNPHTALPIPPHHLYNPNPYYNPLVPQAPFVHPPPMFTGPPLYHPPIVHSSPINPNSTSQPTSHQSSNSSYSSSRDTPHVSSRDIPPLSSPLHDSDETQLKEVIGSTRSSSLHIEGPPDTQKPLHAANDGNGDDGDDNDDDNGDCRGQQNGRRNDDQRGERRDPQDRDHRENRRHHDRHRRNGNNYHGRDQNQGGRNQNQDNQYQGERNQGGRNQNQNNQYQGCRNQDDQYPYPYYDPYQYYDYYQWPRYPRPPDNRYHRDYDDDRRDNRRDYDDDYNDDRRDRDNDRPCYRDNHRGNRRDYDDDRPCRDYHRRNRRNNLELDEEFEDDDRVRMTKYDGKVNWKAWFMQFYDIADRRRWNYTTKLGKMKELLKDDALAYFSRLPLNVRESYRLLCAKMNLRFGQKDTPRTAQTQLFVIKQKDEEELEEWAERCMSVSMDGWQDHLEVVAQEQAVNAFLVLGKEIRL